MTTLSKEVSKSQKSNLCNVFRCSFYNTKNRLHFSSQYIEFYAECDGSVSEIPPIHGHPGSVASLCCQITTQRE